MIQDGVFFLNSDPNHPDLRHLPYVLQISETVNEMRGDGCRIEGFFLPDRKLILYMAQNTDDNFGRSSGVQWIELVCRNLSLWKAYLFVIGMSRILSHISPFTPDRLTDEADRVMHENDTHNCSISARFTDPDDHIPAKE